MKTWKEGKEDKGDTKHGKGIFSFFCFFPCWFSETFSPTRCQKHWKTRLILLLSKHLLSLLCLLFVLHLCLLLPMSCLQTILFVFFWQCFIFSFFFNCYFFFFFFFFFFLFFFFLFFFCPYFSSCCSSSSSSSSSSSFFLAFLLLFFWHVMLSLSYGHDCMQVKEQLYYKTRENKKKHDFLHPRSWIEVLKHYVLRRFSSLKKIRAFLSESVFGHFRSYALKIGIIRDFGHRWKTRVVGTFWFSEALGSAEPEAF